MSFHVICRLMLPLLLVNITTAANMWEVLGIGVGQLSYWILIGLAWYIVHKSGYSRLALWLVVFALGMRSAEFFGGGLITSMLRMSALGILFVVAGARVFGTNPYLLHRQLVVFLALSIPVMLLQISGASPVWMMWNTEYAHDLSILALDEIGTFKEIPVYPTLFVAYENLYYQIGQGRPVGLLYSNNVLSFFVAVAVAVNLAITRSHRFQLSDLIVTMAIVLTMSKLVYVVTIVLYLGSLVLGTYGSRPLAIRLLIALPVGLLVYSLLFPGLFESLMQIERLLYSFIVRMMDIVPNIGLSDFFGAYFSQQMDGYNLRFTGETGSTSQLAVVSASRFFWLGFVLCIVLFFKYLKRVNRMKVNQANVEIYMVLLFVIIFSQFALTYVGAISYQFIAGAALYPLFKKLHIFNQ